MIVVKIGGGDLDLDAVAEDLASLERPFVLLHGANRLRDELAEATGRPPQILESVSGYTSVLSDDDAIDMLLAAYAGIRNKRIVEALRRRGVDALGLTGLDGGLVSGERNRGIRTIRDGKKVIVRDNSGKARRVNGALLRTLIGEGFTPVITVPIAAEDGAALNSENDDVLALLAPELEATDVVSLIEAPGLLEDAGDERTLVPRVEPEALEEWEGRVSGRMRRKIRSIRMLFEAEAGARIRYRLADGRVERPVSRALEGAGTLIAASASAAAAGSAADGDAAGGGEGASEPPGSARSTSAAWLERQAAHELDVYGKRGIAIVSGDGARVRDVEGRSYLDCVGGMGSLALGHRHPELAAAMREQMGRIWFVPGSFGSPPKARFLERLHERLPPELDRTFLSNSGTEALEGALKVARAHTERSNFVSAVRGFHGRTLGALSVTAEARYRAPFEPLLGDVRRVPFNHAERLRAAIDDGVAAVVLEPVQGEGGVHPAEPDFLAEARAACDEHGALLVFDEVQTGFGRTGTLFAFERYGIVPDVLCLAKSIAGGLPLGATVVREGITLPVGMHGSTFGGNPIACAAASATLDILTRPGFLAEVERKGARLEARLADTPSEVVREVRRAGLLVGVQLRQRVRPLLEALQADGVLALSAGSTVLRLLPPLVITDGELDEVANAVLRGLNAWAEDSRAAERT